MEEKNEYNIANHEEKRGEMGGRDVRWHSKKPSSFWTDHLVAKGFYFDVNAKHSKYICVNLLEHNWEVVIDVFRNLKVEKDIKAAHGKVVEEAQEIDADWERRGEWSDKSCGICG